MLENGSYGDFDGFRIGIILPSFLMLGMLLCWIDRLNISVRAPMATGASCFRCLYEMPSEPTEEVDFVYSIACLVMLEVKIGGGSFCGRYLRCNLSIFVVFQAAVMFVQSDSYFSFQVGSSF